MMPQKLQHCNLQLKSHFLLKSDGIHLWSCRISCENDLSDGNCQLRARHYKHNDYLITVFLRFTRRGAQIELVVKCIKLNQRISSLLDGHCTTRKAQQASVLLPQTYVDNPVRLPVGLSLAMVTGNGRLHSPVHKEAVIVHIALGYT